MLTFCDTLNPPEKKKKSLLQTGGQQHDNSSGVWLRYVYLAEGRCSRLIHLIIHPNHNGTCLPYNPSIYLKPMFVTLLFMLEMVDGKDHQQTNYYIAQESHLVVTYNHSNSLNHL